MVVIINPKNLINTIKGNNLVINLYDLFPIIHVVMIIQITRMDVIKRIVFEDICVMGLR